MSRSMGAVNWGSLLPELLVSIAESIVYYEDFVSFSGICRSWQSAAESIGIDNFTGPSRFPSLMLAERRREEDEKADEETREFLLLPNKTIRRINLPECRNKRCLSSKGWIMTLDTDEGCPHLVHLTSRDRIRLPRLDTFAEFAWHNDGHVHFIRKFVLSSSDPTSDEDFLVMVLWGAMASVGFCRVGDAFWTAATDNMFGFVYDIAYVNRMLYAFTGTKVVECDVHGLSPTRLRSVLTNTGIKITGKSFYISGLGLGSGSGFDQGDDKLLLISRHGMWDGEWMVHWVGGMLRYPNPEYRSKTFEVFMLSLQAGELAKLENLGGNRSLFVGYNSSFCIDTSATYGCIKPDCIYFTDDLFECYINCSKGGGKDMGIYHLSSGEIERFLNGRESCSVLSPPLWVFDESAS